MSIFSTIDAALPLITQLIQVKLHDDAELLHWWRRCVALEGYIAFENDPDTLIEIAPEGRFFLESRKVRGSKITGQMLHRPTLKQLAGGEWVTLLEKDYTITDSMFTDQRTRQEAMLAGYSDAQFYWLEKFRDTCIAARQVMTILGVTGGVPINHLENMRQTPTQLDRLESRYTAEPYVPIEHFAPRWLEEVRYPASYVVRHTEDALKSIRAKQTSLKICPECENVYVATRIDQTYCSHRCADRAGKRKRRMEKKNAPNTTSY